MKSTERLLPIRIAAEPLGISARTLRDLIQRGLVEAVRIGGSIRVRQSTVASLIEHGTISPKPGADRAS